MQKPSKEYERMEKEESYVIDEYLFSKQQECSSILTKINKLPFKHAKRERLFNKLFCSLGENNIIKEGFKCNYGFNISIGSNCYINYDVVILDSYKVEIGNNVFIAPKVVISPVTHSLDMYKRRNLIGDKVVIKDNVWIGAGAVILPGVTINEGAVIGAGAIVKEDVASKTVVAGVPAKVIKHL